MLANLPRRLVSAAVLVTLAGCTANQQAPPAPTQAAETAKAKKQRLESVKTDCMKTRGFKYVPFVMPERRQTEEQKKRRAGDYEAMRKDRARLGFYVYYTYIFKKDAEGNDLVFDDPNNKITSKLSKTQTEAWEKATDECYAEAAKVVYNKVVKSESDFWLQHQKLSEQVTARELNGDPQLVELGLTFGDCLKRLGYKVASVRPTDLNERGGKAIQEEASALAEEQFGKKRDMPEGSFMMPRLTAAEAKPYLQREIKAALDDLDCGKEFYAAYMPLQAKVRERVNAEFGLGS